MPFANRGTPLAPYIGEKDARFAGTKNQVLICYFVNEAFYSFDYEAKPIIKSENNATCQISAFYVACGAVTIFFPDLIVTITGIQRG